jgi:hypothetical protein
MYTHNLLHRVRTLARPGLAAGVLVTLALLSAACSNDSASRITAPSLSASMDKSSSAAASNFVVLANQAVTCTDGKITGDVGTFQAPPAGSVTKTSCPITGTVHVGDAAAVSAYKAFVAEYDALAPAPGYCNVNNTFTGTLAGAQFSPGVYCISSEAKTGVLTLTGNGEWTFLVADGALTGTNFSVVMADGGDPCNVTWWVDAAATMTDSHFIGTILAGAGITLTRGTFDGNAWAGASGVGDVTITGTDVTGCEGRKGNRNAGERCNQGVGNGPEICDPGNSNQGDPSRSNDERGGTPGNPGRKGGNGK